MSILREVKAKVDGSIKDVNLIRTKGGAIKWRKERVAGMGTYLPFSLHQEASLVDASVTTGTTQPTFNITNNNADGVAVDEVIFISDNPLPYRGSPAIGLLVKGTATYTGNGAAGWIIYGKDSIPITREIENGIFMPISADNFAPQQVQIALQAQPSFQDHVEVYLEAMYLIDKR